MSGLPAISGPVTIKKPDSSIVYLNTDLAGHVAKAQRDDLRDVRNRAAERDKDGNQICNHDIATGLSDYLINCFKDAKMHRASLGIDAKFQRNLNHYYGRYTAREIMLMGGQETAVWWHLTNKLVRTFVAFLRKTLAGSEIDMPQFDLRPSTIPDPPPEMVQRAQEMVLDFIELSAINGQLATPEEVQRILEGLADTMYNNLRDEAYKKTRRAKREVQDELERANWSKVFDEILHDLALYGTCIVYGPYPEIKKRQHFTQDSIEVRHERSIGMRRLDPQRVYPSRDSEDANDGSFIIIHDTITKTQLLEARSYDDWIDEAICTVLADYEFAPRDWCARAFSTGMINETEITQAASGLGMMGHPQWGHHEEIDILKMYGKVPGRLLHDHGVKEFDGRVVSVKESYEVELYQIGHAIVRIKCNIDPLCERPISKAVLFDAPGRFHGVGVADTVETQQRLVNAEARAHVRNLGFASAPIFEKDHALLTDVDNKGASGVFPGQILHKNSLQTGLSGQALHVHQIDARSEFLINVARITEDAEHLVGLPRFLSGSHSGGGAARTLGGLNQLTENASVQIRSSILNLDLGVIKPIISRVHRWIIFDRNDPGLYADTEVISMGATALLARQVNRDKLVSLIGLLMPFTSSGHVSQPGINLLLGELIRDFGFDPEQILTSSIELQRFSELFRQQLAGAPGVNGGVAAASLPGGTNGIGGGAAALPGQTAQVPGVPPPQAIAPVSPGLDLNQALPIAA